MTIRQWLYPLGCKKRPELLKIPLNGPKRFELFAYTELGLGQGSGLPEAESTPEFLAAARIPLRPK